MSVDISGNLALLGSRRNLTLIDLNKPKEVVKRISLSSKWDIGKVKWNPFEQNQHYFLTTVSCHYVFFMSLLSLLLSIHFVWRQKLSQISIRSDSLSYYRVAGTILSAAIITTFCPLT